MTLDLDEPTRLNIIDEAPAAFVRAFGDSFPSRTSVRLMIYAPGVTVEDVKLAATLLVLTDDAWILASENGNGSVSLDKCSFSETLFLQVTSIVLWGSLHIDYASGGASYSAVMWFNTVREELTRRRSTLCSGGSTKGRRRQSKGATLPIARLSRGRVTFAVKHCAIGPPGNDC